jgi:hypothetical protein
MMPNGQPRHVRSTHMARRIGITQTGALLCLLVLVLFVGRTPTVHAAGVPYCGQLADEHAPTRSAIHLNRTEGPVGTDLTVTDSGWHPGTYVTMHFDGRNPKTGEIYTLIPEFASGIVDNDGTVTLSSLNAPSFFCVDISTPAYTAYRFDQSGGVTGYFVLASNHGEVSAPTAFRYLPAPTVALSGVDTFGGAKVGSTLTVTGSDWEPHEPLTLTLLSADPAGPGTVPNAARTDATTDTQGHFTATYPLDAHLRWNANVTLHVEGGGPRFGILDAFDMLFLEPAIQPTLRVDHTLVTPGMTITMSGEHWFPGDRYTITYCDAAWSENGWGDGPDCGKESNPALGTVTISADGDIHQQFVIPNSGPPRVILLRVNELASWITVQPVPIQVVADLPTWDETHPRVAALRNDVVGSLPFTLPAALLLASLAFVAIRRWRVSKSRP